MQTYTVAECDSPQTLPTPFSASVQGPRIPRETWTPPPTLSSWECLKPVLVSLIGFPSLVLHTCLYFSFSRRSHSFDGLYSPFSTQLFIFLHSFPLFFLYLFPPLCPSYTKVLGFASCLTVFTPSTITTSLK